MNFPISGNDKQQLISYFRVSVRNTFGKSVDHLCSHYGFTFKIWEDRAGYRIDFYTNYRSDISITSELLRKRRHKELLQYVLDKETGVLQV